MVPIRKSRSNSLAGNTREVLLAHINRGDHLAIALSGGMDSVVLLHVLASLSKEIQFTLSAIHVHHGISRNALLWSKFCCDLCYAYNVPIYVAYVQVKKEAGISLEASAREERYRIFDRVHADYVVLAQHLDDQAETLLLQLFRGAGIRGLSAMPIIRKQTSKSSPPILRPLLEVSRSRIEDFARQHKLNWITDESNADIVFNRNFLRHEILPVLRNRYPKYPEILLRTSRHLSEASQLLDELAEIDRENCIASGRLQIENLRKLSFPRAKNLFRYCLLLQDADLPSTIKLDEILSQLLSISPDHQFHVSFGVTEIRSYKGAIYILPRKKNRELVTEYQQVWHGETFLDLQDVNGRIHFMQQKDQGINQQKLLNHLISIRSRKGGERFMPACNRPRRSLKNLLQEASIPPWERNVMPLLFCDEKLVWVPGIGVDCEFQVESGEWGISPIWSSGQS